MCVCLSERESEGEILSVCALCVCVFVRERERVCVSVCERVEKRRQKQVFVCMSLETGVCVHVSECARACECIVCMHVRVRV